GQGEGGDLLASGQAGQPALLLRLAAGQEDGIAPEALDREQLLGGRAGPRQRLADHAEGHRAERPLQPAAVRGGDEQREDAFLAERPGQLPVQLVALAPRLGQRAEDLGPRAGDEGVEPLLLGRQLELTHPEPAGATSRMNVSALLSTRKSTRGRLTVPSSRTRIKSP